MHYTKVISALRKFKDEMPTLVGNEMVNYALDNLHDQKTVTGAPMAPRKANATRNEGRRILIDTGDGERSIRDQRSGNVVEVTANDYMIGHNETGSITVRAHTRTRNGKSYSVKSFSRTMPNRTFLASTKELDKRIVNALQNRFKQLIK